MAEQDSITPGKPPAFQFYPKDFLTDENVRVMSLQERGAYITLICQCWLEGTLPKDTTRLARLVGVPIAAFRRLWAALEPCFRDSGDQPNRLVHPRLERERQKQAMFSEEQSERGKRGAQKRWRKDGTAIPAPLAENGDATKAPMANDSSPISDLQSSSAVRTFRVTHR